MTAPAPPKDATAAPSKKSIGKRDLGGMSNIPRFVNI